MKGFFSFKQPSILQEIDNYSKLLNMSLKQDISGHESLGCTLLTSSLNTQQGWGESYMWGGSFSINKTKMDIISVTFPKKPKNPHLYIHTNSIQWKPNSDICGWISTEFWGKSSQKKPLRQSEGLPLGLFNGWSDSVRLWLFPSDCRSRSEGIVPPTSQLIDYNCGCVWEFTGESLKTEKSKFNGEGRGRGQGATSRVQVTQLLFKSVSGVCLTAVP